MLGTWQGIVDCIAELLGIHSVIVNPLEPPDLEVFRSNAGPDNLFPGGT